MNFFNYFKLLAEKEDYTTVKTNIEGSIVFKGTNLWILIFAIFVASLGLNVNSTAVVIGAMLISPLMGPIIGLGFGAGINDLHLIKKSMFNYLFSSVVALATSTLYFLITPINDAHSEILSRTYPTIYDVLIAFFGGLAGILAHASKQKGNVIPGVAIATALMPPLCTAGYGLATGNWQYFFGAFYLYFINTVFIGIATYLTVKYLRFPYAEWPDEKEEKRSRNMILIITTIAILPSLYLSYNLFRENKFNVRSQNFINQETHFENSFLLSKKVLGEERHIELVYGGDSISQDQIKQLKEKMKYYQISDTCLIVKQGFANKTMPLIATTQKESHNEIELINTLNLKQQEIEKLKSKLADEQKTEITKKEICKELSILYPGIVKCIIEDVINQQDSSLEKTKLVLLGMKPVLTNKKEKEKIENWLKERMGLKAMELMVQ